MVEVLVYIETVRFIASALHYTAGGDAFYALHLMADKASMNGFTDELIEAYWLGQKQMLPPTLRSMSETAAKRCEGIDNADWRALVDMMAEACADGICAVEEAKREEGLTAGVHAILDSISQAFLVNRGLCWRTSDGGEHSEG